MFSKFFVNYLFAFSNAVSPYNNLKRKSKNDFSSGGSRIGKANFEKDFKGGRHSRFQKLYFGHSHGCGAEIKNFEVNNTNW